MTSAIYDGIPCRPIAHQILGEIRKNVDGIWSANAHICPPTIVISMFGEHMEIQGPMATTLHILAMNHNVVGWLLVFVYLH